MVQLNNYHTHSKFSDGSLEPEAYVEEAIRQGFAELGFSEHSVLPFGNTFALQPGTENLYVAEIKRLQLKYKDRIRIYLALEADFIPGTSSEFSGLKSQLGLDYIIGSVHLVENTHPGKLWFIDGPKRETYDNGLIELFGGDIRKGVTAYWNQINQMITREEFDIIGHLDKIKMHNQGRWFSEEADWYCNLVNETVALIAEKHRTVEVNTRGIYKGRSSSLFPGEYILRLLAERKIPVVLSSDAHQPAEISLFFNEARKIMQECGIKTLLSFENGKWTETAL